MPGSWSAYQGTAKITGLSWLEVTGENKPFYLYLIDENGDETTKKNLVTLIIQNDRIIIMPFSGFEGTISLDYMRVRDHKKAPKRSPYNKTIYQGGEV